jgi:hypothetical protein
MAQVYEAGGAEGRAVLRAGRHAEGRGFLGAKSGMAGTIHAWARAAEGPGSMVVSW